MRVSEKIGLSEEEDHRVGQLRPLRAETKNAEKPFSGL
jgi:hypothetical protein